jgi:hypothetical protein
MCQSAGFAIGSGLKAWVFLPLQRDTRRAPCYSSSSFPPSDFALVLWVPSNGESFLTEYRSLKPAPKAPT